MIDSPGGALKGDAHHLERGSLAAPNVASQPAEWLESQLTKNNPSRILLLEGRLKAVNAASPERQHQQPGGIHLPHRMTDGQLKEWGWGGHPAHATAVHFDPFLFLKRKAFCDTYLYPLLNLGNSLGVWCIFPTSQSEVFNEKIMSLTCISRWWLF